MSEGEALLAAVLSNPDDDTPRLVYADWIEEHGQPDRAAFIRTQIEAVRAEPFSKQAREAEKRANELLNRYRNWKEWTDAIRDHVQIIDFRFERGFVSHVDVEPGAFLRMARELFQDHPVQSLRLVPHTNPDLRAELSPVFELPCLKQLKKLAFAPRTEFLYEDYEAMSESAHLGGITELAIRESPFDPPRLEEILTSKRFPSLAGLDLSDSSHLGPAVSSALVRACHRDIRRLDVSRVQITSELWLEIFKKGCIQSIEELRLGWSPLPSDTGPLFHINIGWVIPWERLVVLDLSGQRLGDEGVKEIVGIPETAALRWLSLADNWLTHESVRLLTAAKHLRLNYLDLRQNKLEAHHIARLRERFPDAEIRG